MPFSTSDGVTLWTTTTGTASPAPPVVILTYAASYREHVARLVYRGGVGMGDWRTPRTSRSTPST
jgi:hypothetical protein